MKAIYLAAPWVNREAARAARAELARQILRGVHYVVQAQKFLEGQALPRPESQP